MTNRETTEPCPICDSQKTEVRFDRERRFKYLKRELVLEGLEHTFCLDCECSFNAQGQVERNNQRFIEFEKSILNGIIAPRKIVQLRQTYNLTQEQAKKIFKATGNSFSKWERGESAPSSFVSNILEAALEEPAIMQNLARRAGINLTGGQLQREDKTKLSRWTKQSFPALVSEHEVVEDQVVVSGSNLKQFQNLNPLVVIYHSSTEGPKSQTMMSDDDLYSKLPEAYMINQFGSHL